MSNSTVTTNDFDPGPPSVWFYVMVSLLVGTLLVALGYRHRDYFWRPTSPPPSTEEVPLHRREFVIMDEIDEDKEKEMEAAIKI